MAAEARPQGLLALLALCGSLAPAAAQPVPWRPLPPQPEDQPRGVVFQPLPAPEQPAPPVVWKPVEQPQPQAPPSWVVVQTGGTGDPATANPAPTLPPASYAEAEARLAELVPTWNDYPTLLRLGQLPTAVLPAEGGDRVSFQQVSPGDGGAAGGSGNQNYGFRAELVLNSNLLVSGYLSYADDPLFAPIPSRPSQPANLWTVYGGSLRARLAGQGEGAGSWQLAAEGALELFSVGSGCGGSISCDGPGTPNIFNTSGEKVFTRNWVGALSLPLPWQANRNLQLSFVPAVSFLPDSQGAGQGGAGTFYGTNISLGLGANYRLGNQVQLFASAMVPLGPGTNAFDADLVYSRVPILSAGANIAVNPRIGLEASITNGFGLSPATAILALPSAPYEPMLSARFAWTPGAATRPQLAQLRQQLELLGKPVTGWLLLTEPNAT